MFACSIESHWKTFLLPFLSINRWKIRLLPFNFWKAFLLSKSYMLFYQGIDQEANRVQEQEYAACAHKA